MRHIPPGEHQTRIFERYLYEGLKKKFEVGLKPIVLIHQNYEGHWDLDEALAYPFVSVHDEHRDKGEKKPLKRRKIEWKSEIHVPARDFADPSDGWLKFDPRVGCIETRAS